MGINMGNNGFFSKIRIGDWEPRTPGERIVAGAIGGSIAVVGLIIGLLVLLGVGLPVLGIGLTIALGAVGLALVLTLGAVLLPVAIVLAPIGLIIWLIIR
jgi:hypothetical protein